MRQRTGLTEPERKKSEQVRVDKHPARQLPRQRVEAQKSEHMRVDTRPTRRFQRPLEHLGPAGALKDVNALNPVVHPHKEHRKGEHLFAQQDAVSPMTFGHIHFDPHAHLLFADAIRGEEHIHCSITEEALQACYHVEANEDAMKKCVKAHADDIAYAVEKKCLADKSMDKSKKKSIHLEKRDLQVK
ncbi:MAG: hypothetical protein ACHQAX_06845 [Gammaproteobacteria bacterium]